MDQRIRRLSTMGAVALVCLVLVTAPVPAAPRDPVQAASIALAAHVVTAVHLEGFGATYVHGGPRVPLASYRADIAVSPDTLLEQAVMTPQGFLAAARAVHATVRAVPMGTEVSYTIGGRAVIGIVNAGNEVDRVLTWEDGEGRGDRLVETVFRDYEKTPGGVWFPTHITQNRGGYPSLDVWLTSVTVDRRHKPVLRAGWGGRS